MLQVRYDYAANRVLELCKDYVEGQTIPPPKPDDDR